MRLRSAFAGFVLCSSALPAIVAAAPVACAAEPNRAVLVVDTGEASFRYCVGFSSESVSGIDLIRLASEQHGLQYSLGYGGQAVCRLQGVGPEGDDCFAEDPYFWGYWHGTASGGWSWSSTGAASYRVEDGDVQGWSWGTGQTGDTHQQPPATPYGSVCPVEESTSSGGDAGGKPGGKRPSAEADDGPATSKGQAAAPETSGSEPAPAGRSSKTKASEPKARKGPGRSAGGEVVVPSVGPEPVTEQVAAPAEPESGGPSPAALVAMLATFGLVAAGGAVARKKKV